VTNEEIIQQKIVNRYPATEGKFRLQRARRIWVEVTREIFLPLFEFAKQELKFVEFCTLTGLDEGENLLFIYHLAQEYTGIVLNLKVAVPKSDPVIPTITNFFPAAELPERELEDLLGAKVAGLAPGPRYPLPDEWPAGDHPLRKDWQPREDEAKPEVPHG
jgi:Ni,Fe-hydrogenase III component G